MAEKTKLKLFSLMLSILLLLPYVLSAGEGPGNRRIFRITDCVKTYKNGVTVFSVPSGTFIVEKTVILPSNSVLEGTGPQTVLMVLPAFTGSRFLTNNDMKKGNVNITVRNIAIDFGIKILKGNFPGIVYFENVDGLFISNITMKIDSDLYGIDLAGGVRKSIIQDCTITNTGNGGGIMVRNRLRAIPAKGISVTQNTIASSRADEPLAVFGWLGKVRDVSLEYNAISANRASFGITVYGIDEPGHTGSIENVRVAKNRVNGGKTGGIAVKGGARKITLYKNSVEGQGLDGIFLHSGGKSLPDVNDVKVLENRISNVGRHCIFAAGTNINVESNVISDCGQSGIYIGGKVTALKNRIINARPGIIVDTDAPRVVENNTLINAYNIRVFNNDYAGIANNVIKEKGPRD